MQLPELIIIGGPTASGKTAVAVSLCEKINGEVVSADSMQIYRGMDILTAMPTKAETRGIAHHMLGIAEPTEKYTVSMYRERARAAIDDILSRGKRVVVCGGTGLYINALTKPLSFSEKSDEKLHDELFKIADRPNGRNILHKMLEEIDPESARRLHENDVRRVARAIEIYKLTGVTQTEQAKIDAMRKGDFDEHLFALDWEREELYARCSARVDEMLKLGLIAEVERLNENIEAYPTAAQAIGYKELLPYLRGEISKETAVELIKQSTRNYAKRQLTWFKHDARTIWISAKGKSSEKIADEIINNLNGE